MFTDIKGFSTLMGRDEPDTLKMLEQHNAVMDPCVPAHGGNLVKRIGGSYMVWFQSALDALTCALTMQQSLAALSPQRQILVRIGINTGDVVFGEDNDLYGNVVNMAKRIEAAAKPGGICVSDLVRLSISRSERECFVFRDPETIVPKGSAEQIRVWHVDRKVSSISPGSIRIQSSHCGAIPRSRWPNPVGRPAIPERPRFCFGRTRELKQISDAIRANCGMICIIGPPGEGKTTLVAQWLNVGKISKRRGLFYCRPDLKHYRFGHFVDDALRYISDDEVDPGNRSSLDRVFDLCEFLRKRPTLLVIDNLETWLCRQQLTRRRPGEPDEFHSLAARSPTDAALDILLKAATSWDNGSALLVTSRALPSVLDERTHCEIGTIRLPGGHRTISPLSSAASIALLQRLGVTGRRAQLISLATRYHGHALLLSVVASVLTRLYGGDSSNISKHGELSPLTDDLAARLSELLSTIAPYHKEDWALLTLLACHPASMSIGLLQQLLGLKEKETRAHVASLVDWHLVCFDGQITRLHGLIREIVYSSCSDSDKREAHQQIADALESQPPHSLNGNYQQLAHHHELAGNSVKALGYMLMAAENAVATVSAFEAYDLFERARQLAGKAGVRITEEQELRLYSGLGAACFRMRLWDKCGYNYNSVLRVALAHDRYRWSSEALAQLGYAKLWQHDFPAAYAYARRAHLAAKECGNAKAMALSLLTEGWGFAVQGKLVLAQSALCHARRLARKAGSVETEALSVCLLGHLSNWKGDFSRAITSWEEVIRIARTERLVALLQWGLFSAGMGYCALNEYETAIMYLQEGKSLCEAIDDRAYRCRMLNTLGWVYLDVCNWKDAIKLNKESADESRELKDTELIFNSETNLADCYVAVGFNEEAKALLERLASDADLRNVHRGDWMGWRYTQRLWCSLGKLRLREGKVGAAMEFAQRCLSAAEKTASKRNRVKGHRLKAEVFLARKEIAEASREIGKAIVIARNLGNFAQLWETHAVAGRIALNSRDLTTARDAFNAANQNIERIASRLKNPLRSVFLGSPQVKEIREIGIGEQ